MNSINENYSACENRSHVAPFKSVAEDLEDQTDTDLNVTHVDYTWLIVKDSVIAIQLSFYAIYSDYFLLHVISDGVVPLE